VSVGGTLQVDPGVHHYPPSGAQPALEVPHDRTMSHVPLGFGDKLIISDRVKARLHP
jgi:hypothetical protein